MRLKQGNGAFAGERIVDGMRKKRFCAWPCLLLAALLLSACASGEPARVTAAPAQRATDARDDAQTEEDAMMKMNVQVGESVFTATLERNAAVEALVEMLREAPVTLQLRDYAGFEKVGQLGTALPAEDSRITTRPGDIALYQGDQIVMFYGSNSWSYTRLGHIDDLASWEEALGDGDIEATFSLEA